MPDSTSTFKFSDSHHFTTRRMMSRTTEGMYTESFDLLADGELVTNIPNMSGAFALATLLNILDPQGAYVKTLLVTADPGWHKGDALLFDSRDHFPDPSLK